MVCWVRASRRRLRGGRFSTPFGVPQGRATQSPSLSVRGRDRRIVEEGAPMVLVKELHREQQKVWPKEGRHILAQYDDDSIIVYQAYRPSIGRYTIEHGYFGGGFSLSRMSWIKPNFLWMMYRCGWGTKEGQEIVLGLRIRREFFDAI